MQFPNTSEECLVRVSWLIPCRINVPVEILKVKPSYLPHSSTLVTKTSSFLRIFQTAKRFSNFSSVGLAFPWMWLVRQPRGLLFRVLQLGPSVSDKFLPDLCREPLVHSSILEGELLF